MEPLPRARRMPALEVDVAGLEPDRLRRPQPAGVHQLQQRAVAQRGRLGPARRLEQLGDLVAREDLRQLAALLGGAQVHGRVVGDQVLPAQVAVEGAQAGDLALDAWPARPAGGPRRRRPGRRRSRRGRCGVAVQRVRAGPAQVARRAGAGRSGRPRACCATGRARTPGRRGSRAAGARTAGWARRRPSDEPPSPPAAAPPARCNAPPMERWSRGRPLHRRAGSSATIPARAPRRTPVSPPQGALLELLARRDRRAQRSSRSARSSGYSTLWLAARCRRRPRWSRSRSTPLAPPVPARRSAIAPR